jgi:hypothetical protein
VLRETHACAERLGEHVNSDGRLQVAAHPITLLG